MTAKSRSFNDAIIAPTVRAPPHRRCARSSRGVPTVLRRLKVRGISADMIDYALVGTCGDSRSERKTTATAHSPIERLGETGAAECQPMFSRDSARTRRSIMDRDLANWNLGMADAESGSLAASGRSRDYYDGYDYACALNYEYTGARPECVGEVDLGHIGNASVLLAASPFSTQLSTLRSLRPLMNSQNAH